MDEIIILALAKKYTDSVGEKVSREGFHVQVEQDRSILNSTGQEKIFYFLPKTSDNPTDGYDEFVYTNNNWEQVGVTDVDLSSYATKAEVGNLNNLPTTDKSSIVSAISETFTSVSNGKTLVASAITDKGVSTSSDATFEIMAQNIEAIPAGSPTVLNPALVLWDWEGTKLAEYSAEDALALTELPAPDTLPPYATADHELLVFQSWNWSLANIKAWLQSHRGETLNVDTIYITTDGQNHNFWNSPRLNTANTISMQKHGMASIGDSAFWNCSSLTHISIPNSVTSIGSHAFDSCYSLTHISIPNSVISIDKYAFQNCNSLTHIGIPDSVTSIGSGTFYLCNSLTHISIPDSVTSIGANAFQNCYSLAQINLPDSVTSIGSHAFDNCNSLTHIGIPDSVTSIIDYAFYNCRSLTHIGIPDSVTSIGSHAFQNCRSLTHIGIPDSVTSIGDSAFYDCITLCDILIESKPILAGASAFGNLPSIYRIYVPRANLSWFETETNWSTIYAQGHIVAIEDYIAYLEPIGFNVDKYKEVA